MIYILKSENLIKVGYSKDVQKRLKSYRSQNPNLKLIEEYYGDVTYEKYFHKHFADPVHGREWYVPYDNFVGDFEKFYSDYLDMYYGHVALEDYFQYKGLVINMQNLIDSGFSAFAVKTIINRDINLFLETPCKAYKGTNSSVCLVIYKNRDLYEEDFSNLGWKCEFCKPLFK